MEVVCMKFKKTIIISIVISAILLICTLLLPNINIDKDTIGYNGNDTYNIKAYNTIRDINKYIKISDNIDEKVIGNYQVTVKVRYLFYRYNKVFDIKVVDNVKPEVELKGNNPSYVCPNKDYDEEGYLRAACFMKNGSSYVRKIFHRLNHAKESIALVVKNNEKVYNTLLDLL